LGKVLSIRGKGLSEKNHRTLFLERETFERMRPMCANEKKSSKGLLKKKTIKKARELFSKTPK
jgi:hypothetical protein